MLEHSFTKYRNQIHEQAEDFDCLHLISNGAIDGMRFNSEAKREQFKVEIAALKRIREKKRPYDHAGGEVIDVDSSSESEQPATAPVSNDRVTFRDEDGDFLEYVLTTRGLMTSVDGKKQEAMFCLYERLADAGVALPAGRDGVPIPLVRRAIPSPAAKTDP